jgi:hypothetical protein
MRSARPVSALAQPPAPDGWKYSRHIVDPTVLDRVKVGDKVDITWNTDVTVAVN